jgi:hypothetical protein
MSPLALATPATFAANSIPPSSSMTMFETGQQTGYHVINTQTGFLENPAIAGNFDSQRKTQFLKLYRDNGIRLRRACRSMGLSEATVSHHYKIDPVFREAFDAVERDYIEELEAVSKENALNPKSVIERIFQLKCLLPERYGQENKPQKTEIIINLGSVSVEKALEKTKILDAETLE